MTKDEALKLAMDWYGSGNQDPDEFERLILSIVAQPEQEPLEYWNAVEGWVKIDEVREHFDSVGCGTIYKTDGEGREPLYTTPPQRTWVGLTPDELNAIFDGFKTWSSFQITDVYFAIEAKLKEKNG
jgi:hypothetical protein